MSYQVLARKWRPRNFATLVGQEHVVRALRHALSENRLHHAYLFTGTRGVGKTTIARILAKSLNCETGITATPCGVCSACQEIDAGRFVDLLEVDAATNTRVDEMRQLLENAIYAPTRGRYKVYVIDEVHMLSTSAFNAMLKTLEEPPEHVKFILATTDPQKIPVTVLSRCLQFNLKQMPVPAIESHLAKILGAEGIDNEARALTLIARSAAGSMRDALSLLDQAIAHGSGKVEFDAVREMLGTVDQDHLLDLLLALLEHDLAAMLGIADDMVQRSVSLGGALHELAALLTRVQVHQLAPASLGADAGADVRFSRVAEGFSPEFIQLAYQIVIQGRADLALAPDEVSGFTMTLLRLHAFRPENAYSLEASPSPAAARPAVLKQGAVSAPPVMEKQSKPAGDDDWHAMMLSLPLNGMARELAQQCELREISGQHCTLRLPPRYRHLQMKPAQEKLQQALSEHFARPLNLRIEVAEVESETPALAAHKERQEKQASAQAAIAEDGFVRDMISTFDAAVLDGSVKPIQ